MRSYLLHGAEADICNRSTPPPNRLALLPQTRTAQLRIDHRRQLLGSSLSRQAPYITGLHATTPRCPQPFQQLGCSGTRPWCISDCLPEALHVMPLLSPPSSNRTVPPLLNPLALTSFTNSCSLLERRACSHPSSPSPPRRHASKLSRDTPALTPSHMHVFVHAPGCTPPATLPPHLSTLPAVFIASKGGLAKG